MTSPISKTFSSTQGDHCWSAAIIYRLWLCWQEDTVPSKYWLLHYCYKGHSQHFRPSSDENVTTSDRWHRGKSAGGCRITERWRFCGNRGTGLAHCAPPNSVSQPQAPGISGLWARNLKTTIQEPCQQLWRAMDQKKKKSYGQTDLKKNKLCYYPRNKHFHIYLHSCGVTATIWHWGAP